MTKYTGLILLISLICGEDKTGKSIFKRQPYKNNYKHIKNDKSNYSKTSSDLLYINYQLKNYIARLNDETKSISIDLCYPNNSYHEIERYNKMMVYPISNTPECIFSLYSSLEYGR